MNKRIKNKKFAKRLAKQIAYTKEIYKRDGSFKELWAKRTIDINIETAKNRELSKVKNGSI